MVPSLRKLADRAKDFFQGEGKSLEKHISDMFFFTGVTMPVIAFVGNAFLGMDLLLNLPSLATAVICLAVPLKFNGERLLTACFLYVSFVYFPYMLFITGGLDSAIVMFFILAFFLLAVALKGRMRIIVMPVLAAWYSGVLCFAGHFQEIVVPYPNHEARVVDFCVSLAMAGILCTTLAVMVSKSYEREHATASSLLRQLEAKNKELLELSILDPLTGVYNRRYLFHCLENEIEVHFRNNLPMCLLLIDLDQFKEINDTYGHSAGDEVLKLTVNAVKGCIRKHEVLARYGGDEFVVILPLCKREDAKQVAEKIRNRVAEAAFRLEVKFTASIGVAALRGGDTPQELLERADTNLYAAKEAGRNRVIG